MSWWLTARGKSFSALAARTTVRERQPCARHFPGSSPKWSHESQASCDKQTFDFPGVVLKRQLDSIITNHRDRHGLGNKLERGGKSCRSSGQKVA